MRIVHKAVSQTRVDYTRNSHFERYISLAKDLLKVFAITKSDDTVLFIVADKE